MRLSRGINKNNTYTYTYIYIYIKGNNTITEQYSKMVAVII